MRRATDGPLDTPRPSHVVRRITASQAQRWGVLGRPPGTERVTADGSPQDPPHHRRRHRRHGHSPRLPLRPQRRRSRAGQRGRRRGPHRQPGRSPRARATTTRLPPARSSPLAIARSQLLANVQTSPDALKGTVALQDLLVGEQIVADKFGANVAEAASPLGIPANKMAISINLTDPDRVAGFVNPGSEVAIFVTGDRVRAARDRGGSGRRAAAHPDPPRPGHGSRRRQHHAGDHDHHGRGRHPADRAAAPYAAHPRPLPGRGGEGDPGVEDYELTFALLTKDSDSDSRSREPRAPTSCPDADRYRKVGPCLSSSIPTAAASAGCSARCRPGASPSTPPTGCCPGCPSTPTSTSWCWGRTSGSTTP